MPRSLGAIRLNWAYSLFAGVVARSPIDSEESGHGVR
jgi:hypothetical protein